MGNIFLNFQWNSWENSEDMMKKNEKLLQKYLEINGDNLYLHCIGTQRINQ